MVSIQEVKENGMFIEETNEYIYINPVPMWMGNWLNPPMKLGLPVYIGNISNGHIKYFRTVRVSELINNQKDIIEQLKEEYLKKGA